MSGRYQAGFTARGSDVPSYPTKAAALRAAKALAREHPGQLVTYFESVYTRYSASPVETTRIFRADERGRVAEI